MSRRSRFARPSWLVAYLHSVPKASCPVGTLARTEGELPRPSLGGRE